MRLQCKSDADVGGLEVTKLHRDANRHGEELNTHIAYLIEEECLVERRCTLAGGIVELACVPGPTGSNRIARVELRCIHCRSFERE